MSVAILGMGIIGREMARSLASSGESVAVFNRTPLNEKDLSMDNITVADNAREAISKADTVLLTLADYPAIEDVLFREEISFGGKGIIQMGTISPRESQELRDRVVHQSGCYLESPFLGSRKEIQMRTVQLLIGAEPDEFERYKPIFQQLSDQIYYIGSVGQAAALKLALNQLIAVHAVGFSLSLGIIQNSGVGTELFMDILKSSALYAPMYDKKLNNWLNTKYSDPNFSTKHLLKDVDLILKHARHIGLETQAIESIQKIVDRAVTSGYGDLDYSSVFETIKQRPND